MFDTVSEFPEIAVRHSRGLQFLEDTWSNESRRLYWPSILPVPKDSGPPADFRWYWGETATGKTSSVYVEFGADKVYSKRATNKWWNGYDPRRHTCILIDDYRDNREFSYADLLELLDVYPISVETKGGYRSIGSACIIVTSNPPPWHIWPMVESDPETGDKKQTPLCRRVRLREFATPRRQVPAPPSPQSQDPQSIHGSRSGGVGLIHSTEVIFKIN